jgi:hypothetical protein
MRRNRIQHELRECAHCHKPIECRRADARYCGDSCRVMAYRARKKTGRTDFPLSQGGGDVENSRK